MSTTSASTSVAFAGLGVMGFPMAGHLVRAGHSVSVWNRSAEKASRWVQAHPQGQSAATPADAARTARVVLMCLGNDDDVRAVVYGDSGLLAGIAPGSVLVDHTTASVELAQELHARCQERGVGFVDAPVSGGQAGAENGQLTIMCGGSQDDFSAAQPVMAAYARAVTRLGDCGSGQKAKMVNQIAIAGLLQGLAEAISFGERAGLPMHQVIDVISQGAAQSWQMNNRAHTMIDGRFDFGFAIDWMAKDLGLVLQEARRNGATLPVTALVDQFYSELRREGLGRSDTSVLIERLREKS
ncbi:NAD(P)-dependent oxidoreductase [Amphibiibacter pelophylacis]|uniref:NAD(P)-dependent oxidoreductase n=1 Tax=Amphibiibacter pelophylacis TaxID=1799477 RepID=A0ACC6NZC8_9BURK